MALNDRIVVNNELERIWKEAVAAGICRYELRVTMKSVN
jgi:hypothetical protein